MDLHYGPETVADLSVHDDDFFSDDHPQTVTAYAKLEFPDTPYYIKTLVVTIGRGSGLPKVLVSDSPPASPSADADAPESRKRKRSIDDDGEDLSSEFQFPGGLGGSQDAESIPDNSEEERVNVYPPADANGQLLRPHQISRRHLQIRWDMSRQRWTVQILGRNGAYINRDFYGLGTTALLENDDIITLSALEFKFVDLGGADSFLNDNDSVSEILEDEMQVEELSTSEDDESLAESAPTTPDDDEEEGTEGQPELPKRIRLFGPKKKSRAKVSSDSEEEEVEAPKSKSKSKSRDSKGGKRAPKSVDNDDASPSIETPARKRGPGRPPADGVMSKKERKDRERAARLGLTYGDDDIPSRAVNKPRKEGDADSEPRKKKKRVKGEDDVETDDSDGETRPRKKATPEPRAPTPKREDFTEDQLQKPDMTYSAQLYEILKDKEPMSLPAIYEAFKAKWPYYRFLDGHGWESSIRHNLQSTSCLMKAGKEGKGHLWKVDPAKPFESKSAKKAAAPRPPPGPAGPGPAPYGYPAYYPPYQRSGQYPYMYANGSYPPARAMPNAPHRPLGPGQAGPAGQAGPGQPARSGPGGPGPQNIGQSGGQPRPDPATPQGQPHAGQGPQGPQGQQGPQAGRPVNGATPQSRPGSTGPQNIQRPQTTSTPGRPQNIPYGPGKGPHARADPHVLQKNRVWDAFKTSLLRSAGDAATRTRYDALVRQALAWLHTHPDQEYNGPPGDVSTVIKQMLNAWRQHPANPARQVPAAAAAASASKPAVPAANAPASAAASAGTNPNTAPAATTAASKPSAPTAPAAPGPGAEKTQAAANGTSTPAQGAATEGKPAPAPGTKPETKPEQIQGAAAAQATAK